jgi:hypothetical protein
MVARVAVAAVAVLLAAVPMLAEVDFTGTWAKKSQNDNGNARERSTFSGCRSARTARQALSNIRVAVGHRAAMSDSHAVLSVRRTLSQIRANWIRSHKPPPEDCRLDRSRHHYDLMDGQPRPPMSRHRTAASERAVEGDVTAVATHFKLGDRSATARSAIGRRSPIAFVTATCDGHGYPRGSRYLPEPK